MQTPLLLPPSTPPPHISIPRPGNLTTSRQYEVVDNVSPINNAGVVQKEGLIDDVAGWVMSARSQPWLNTRPLAGRARRYKSTSSKVSRRFDVVFFLTTLSAAVLTIISNHVGPCCSAVDSRRCIARAIITTRSLCTCCTDLRPIECQCRLPRQVRLCTALPFLPQQDCLRAPHFWLNQRPQRHFFRAC
jgi:hypothetical protein